ncbi:MipA/OmpV family protein [Moraxella sp. Tifton1]|uniref:MipA/OmpV family protein n=1 Tax=Moraxella oculi TaxID=2940516 RepID=UPI0020137FD6|nr:MipA/OmpV family protein [Moraxella sp. Tifton1]MCL1622802.1 MipA/OmpV family protein [Moraxella sp. Tifton1]
MKNLHPFMTAIVIVSFYSQAHAERLPVDTNARLSIGLNVSKHSANAYKANSTFVIAPHGFYDNHRWYIEGGEAGFYPYKDKHHHARIGMSYDGTMFEPKQAEPALQNLTKRQASVMAIASYMYVSPIGGFRAKIAKDALSRHEGMTITLSHISRFNKDKMTVYPSFGMVWQDKKYNAYYYGISNDESQRTGVVAYDPNDGVIPFASVLVNYDLNDKTTLFASQRIEWLPKAIKDSPMVDDEIVGITRLGINRKF